MSRLMVVLGTILVLGMLSCSGEKEPEEPNTSKPPEAWKTPVTFALFAVDQMKSAKSQHATLQALAEMAIQSGDNKQALQFLQQAREIALKAELRFLKVDIEGVTAIATAEHQAGDDKAALETLRQLREIDLSNEVVPVGTKVNFYARLAARMVEFGDPSEALRTIDLAFRFGPKLDAEDLAIIAAVLTDSGNPTRALEALKDAKELAEEDRKKEKVLTELGYALARVNRHDEAQTAFREAHRLRQERFIDWRERLDLTVEFLVRLCQANEV
ncbi:MAG: tetratricopeptide repeat protein, partial [Planctomycetaceae bacterium]|nr:tetratricopeptide repeat protein [Planctomycetaceae bacterium]